MYGYSFVSNNGLIFEFLSLAQKRLILVSAPAGYGKTSLLVDFVGKTTLPICWYSIDRLDYDPLRFISYLAASIKQKFPGFGKRTAAALSGGQGKFDGEYIATVMINDVYENISEHFLIILDDYHLVNDNLDIRKFMSRLLMDLDGNCHFLLLSRTLLSLPDLPLLVARSEVAGLSYEELGFIPQEIQQLYQQNQHVLISLDTAEEIQSRTEGWVTGILLTSQVNEKDIVSRDRIHRASGFSLDNYFANIIDQFPDDLRSFLLWTSLLEEFNAERCAEVIGPVISEMNLPWQKWINTIQQNNLFTMPVGERGDWLRYHPLFLDYLQNCIYQEQPSQAIAIQMNLANLCKQKGEWEQAFSIYRSLNATEELVSLIEEAGLDMIVGGRISTLSAWLDSLPIEVLSQKPYIVALQGDVAMILGNTTLALSLLNQAIDSIELNNNLTQRVNALTMRAATLRLTGKLEEAISDSDEILSLVGDQTELLKQKAEALRCIGLCNLHRGKLQDALTELEKALRVMKAISDSKNVAIIQLEIGLVYENLGTYTLSKKYYLLALEYWQVVENPLWLSNTLNNLGVLQQLMGDYQEAGRSFEKALEYARSCGYARMEAYILTGIGDIYSDIQADEQALQAYYLAEGIADGSQEHFLRFYLNLQKAAIFSFQGDFESSHRFLQQAKNLIGKNGSAMEINMIDLEFAGVKIREKKGHEIIQSLQKTCEYFQKEGHKVQYEKARLFLSMIHLSSKESEKATEHLLHVFSSLQGDYLPTALIANAARNIDYLKTYHPILMQVEFEQFLQQISNFIKKLPMIRRDLRENSRAVPFSKPKIIINSLGRMKVEINNHFITSSEWQTQFARDMFFLLLAHPEGMTKEEISLIFWPDANMEEVKFRFKNTVYRLRRALGKDTIILDQNLYRFNNKVDYEYDVEKFLKENAVANQSQEAIEKLTHYREALKYYRGNYVADIDATWAFSPREYLRQTYLNILLQVSSLYFNQSNYDLAMDYCQRAITEDSLLEDAYRLAMRIFAAMGNRAGLVQQYQRCVEVLEREINATPSTQTYELLQYLLK